MNSILNKISVGINYASELKSRCFDFFENNILFLMIHTIFIHSTGKCDSTLHIWCNSVACVDISLIKWNELSWWCADGMTNSTQSIYSKENCTPHRTISKHLHKTRTGVFTMSLCDQNLIYYHYGQLPILTILCILKLMCTGRWRINNSQKC